MGYTLRPLTLGQLLDTTFDVYRKNFWLFAGISAVPNTVLLLLQLGVTAWNGASGDKAAGSASAPEGLGLVLASLLTIVATLFASSIVTAAVTFGVSDIYLDVRTSIVACFSRVAGKALRVVYVSIAVGFIVGVGLFLCVIPGVYWSGKYGIAIPAVVLEDVTGSEALGRSGDLTQGAVGRVIVISLLTAIFIWAMAAALDLGVAALMPLVFPHAGTLTGQVWQQLTSAIASIVLDPVTAIALTLVYYDQRVRREAFDIEHLTKMLGAPKDAASSPSVS